MNSYLALRKTSFCVAYKDVGEGREQEALSFANLRNSSLLRAIRRLKSDFSEYNLFRPELTIGSLVNSIFVIANVSMAEVVYEEAPSTHSQ